MSCVALIYRRCSSEMDMAGRDGDGRDWMESGGERVVFACLCACVRAPMDVEWVKRKNEKKLTIQRGG